MSMTKKNIYLDFAAATPLDAKVLHAMQPYMTEDFYNPSAPYQPAREVRISIETARASVAHLLGAKPTEIIFTAGATESINLAFTMPGHVVVSSIEHVAVLQTAQQHEYSIVPVDSHGRVELSQLADSIRDDTTIVSIGLVNNEIGVVQSLRDIAKIIKDFRRKRRQEGNSTPLYLHSDVSQAAGILDLNIARLGVDLLTLNGGKMYGPKQSGILYVASGVVLKPLIYGGGQESGLRSGTENVAAVIGFAKAFELAEKKRKNEVERFIILRQKMIEIFSSEWEDMIILGHKKHQAPHILTVSWDGLDAERVLFGLENENILVATGSACAANKDTRSHVLAALGLAETSIDGSLRLSFGRSTTLEQVEQAAKIINMTIKKELHRGK